MGVGETQKYGDPSYWDKRYKQDKTPFDWYQNYSSLVPLFHLYLSPPHRRVLVVGCGNSSFSEKMAADGYEDIVNIDISSVVIEEMQKKYSDHPQLKYITMDVLKMDTLETGSFDAVIDKGTLDTILCGNNSKPNSAKMLEEVGRVLKDKGVYILVTYGAPSYRLCYLKNSCKWKIKLHVIDKPSDEEGTTVRQYRRMLVLIDGINRRNVPLAEPALSPDSEVQQTAASQAQPFDQEAERWPVDIMSETLPFIY
uniref:Methyltransferase type 11 domain-containing protein n=1 Tax=Chenopodium quinoa TaxID=63459 RepID=A0A803KU59_CHEQI